ncbi:MAG: phosphonate ABC transporter, permease protein PhnE [Alphaproteobacteria bacterium]|nr:phosphonate ABC transporter, permease protein PhnE [Alphaproteobacteria bacterium]
MSLNETLTRAMPQRWQAPGLVPSLLFCVFIAFFAWSLSRAGISIPDLIAGIPAMGTIASEMVPPATDRLLPMMNSVLTTFQMALVGAGIGIVLSFPIAILATRTLSPHPIVYSATRAFVSFVRTVPDLAWALFFVASVGLGPFAGTLALIMDTIGFCGRFFAESMEEVDPGPSEALAAMGAKRADIIACAVVPAATPGLTNASLYSLEKAVRSSVVLGLVGAGGIGAELAVSMEMFRYDQAATIVLMIFVLVLGVERFSAYARSKFLDGARPKL